MTEVAPLKVVHLLQGLEVGGLEIMVAHLLERLDPRRFQSQVIGYDSLGPLAYRLGMSGIPAFLLKRRPGVDVRYILRLARHLAAIRPHILHLHNPTAFFYGTLAGKLARVPCIVYTEHGRDLASSKRNQYLHRLLGRLVNRIVVVSESGRALLQAEGIPGERILTIHNGVDAARFLIGEDRWGMRARLGFDHEQPLLGIVARLDAIKNHASLLRALPRVMQTHPDATLLIIGDGPLRADLERQVSELGLGRSVRFLGTRDDVPELLATLDVVVLCSLSEGLSLTLLEQSAAGKPMVATDVGGNQEIIEDGQTGLLVPVNDEEALASAINRLLDDPERAHSIGRAARLQFMREFTVARMVSRYVEVYEGCAPAASSRMPKEADAPTPAGAPGVEC
ncbi:MAG: GT4 family glycosyltransferase PelF [Pseudomonadota bacterium]|nr:GT4 family glycosyltransferase PelF [Pseudomonadota bacterium]MDP1903296.1 GT4 family glycosyltransferase PelF [Pseudomonadota bacterium]MDP2353380.1 GT4 family glycosyltransferase PelF [Pseudomonadota bacterium]